MNSPKYPRTFHLPWSPGVSSDDKVSTDVSGLIKKYIFISEKLDGSNVCVESSSCYARSHAGTPTHSSFDEFKQLHARLKYQIPENTQFFGEWLFAKHSIQYENLPSYFFLFGIRNMSTMTWFSWTAVQFLAKSLKLQYVPVLFEGKVESEKELKNLTDWLMNQPSLYGKQREGLVVRYSESFSDKDFSKYVQKCVRKNHVTTDIHWKSQQIIKNKLAK